ncbi:Fur family transcriptional regulator [Hyella patelloides]|nr:Fur family transcriptional regulator [Hyella patelloides]
MNYSAESITATLKSKGLRVTPQRFAVYSNLLSRSDHPTVEQILEELNQNFPISSLATIYSSLQVLREVGLVQEVLLEEGVSRYDANMEKHHHFRCSSCGAIEDIPSDRIEDLNLDKLRPDLKVTTYEIIVHGLCDRC